MVFDDRRRAIRLTGDRDTFIATSRLIPSSGLRLSRTLLATAGDRLALEHLRWTGTADGGAFEGENLSLTEVDAEGRIVAIISFDADDRRAAGAELRGRFFASDTSRWIPARIKELAYAIHDHDLDRLRAAVPDDFVFHDHRRTGGGRIEGADAYVAWLAALFEQSPDASIEPLYIIAADPDGYLAIAHTFGTRVEGGQFESVFVQLVSFPDGQPVGADLFELAGPRRGAGAVRGAPLAPRLDGERWPKPQEESPSLPLGSRPRRCYSGACASSRRSRR